MESEDNAENVRRGYEAFTAGDTATLNGLFAEDVVWEVPGDGALAGRKQGREAVLSYLAELVTRTNGTLDITVLDIIGGDRHTIGIHHATARRDTKTLDQDVVLVFELHDGQTTRVREFQQDPATTADFLA